MTNALFSQLAIVPIIVAALSTSSALAQSHRNHAAPTPAEQQTPIATARTPSVAIETGNAVIEEPASVWSAWRAFHDSLEFYGRSSPGQVRIILTERAGLTSNEIDAFLQAGHEYLLRLSEIDQAARAEIAARFPSETLPTVLPQVSHPANLPRPEEFRQLPPELRPMGNPGNKSRYQTLREDGFISRLDRTKESALQSHRELIARLVGSEKLAAIDQWISDDVAPSVKVVTRATLLSAPPSVDLPVQLDK